MTLVLPALPENVALARVALAAFAAQIDFTLGEIEEIKVAVSEAVSNAVLHAYPGGPGEVRVEGRLYPDRLEVVVEDSGQGMEDVGRARRAGFSSQPERLGLGFTFMESFMDGLEVESAVGRGTTVRMVKRPGSPAARQEGGAAQGRR
ncbi:MAG: anti-sigma F factor [Acetobacteraceae bacterium]|nr:anti-sigma F factor [Acetobacteraceae bacterium]